MGNRFLISRELSCSFRCLAQIFDCLCGQTCHFKMMGQLDCHLLGLFSKNVYQRTAHRFMQIAPLCRIETLIEVRLKENVPEAIMAEWLIAKPLTSDAVDQAMEAAGDATQLSNQEC